MVPSLHLYFWKIFSASLQVILTDSCSVNSCSLVCLWEGCEPRVPPTPLSRLLQSVLALFNQVDVRVPCLTEQVRRGESTACIIWKRMKRNVLICSSVQMLFSQYILQEWFGFLEKIQQLAFPGSSAGKESTCNAGDPKLGSPGLGRSSLGVSWVGKIPWRRERLPQCSGLENSMDCIVHGVTNSWT